MIFFIQLPLLTKDNFNEIFNRFNHLILQAIGRNAPLKKVSWKQKKLHKKPWLTHELLNAIKDKRKMYKTHFLSGNSAQKELYKRFSNKLTKMKTRAKRNYFENELQNHSGNPKKLGKFLNHFYQTSPFKMYRLVKLVIPLIHFKNLINSMSSSAQSARISKKSFF